MVVMATSFSTFGPPSSMIPFCPIRGHNPNGILIDSAVLAQMTAECPYTLQWGATFPLKIATSHGGYEPPSNTWFPGPTRVLNPNGISIGSAVFAGLTSVTDRALDRPTGHATPSVTIGHIYICSTAMRPKMAPLQILKMQYIIHKHVTKCSNEQDGHSPQIVLRQ